jgi:hypothetical protein
VGGGVAATYYSLAADNLTLAAPLDAVAGGAGLAGGDGAGRRPAALGAPGGAGAATAAGPWGAGPLARDNRPYAVRWAGLVMSLPARPPTWVQWGPAGAADRVRVWVDNSLVIDQWCAIFIYIYMYVCMYVCILRVYIKENIIRMI